MNISELNPQLLWSYFDKLCSIPHPSGGEAHAIEWLKEVAESHSLDWQQDKVGNILIKAPATAGCESRPTITMQAHIDMVCEKNSDVEHDFEHDPIDTYIEDGWVRARGTTLGADCGIGVAAALATLTDPNLEHGALEALITIDEERGLTGAFGLGEGMIGGDYLLNLDSEDEGEIFIGCAGGVDTTAYFTPTFEAVDPSMALRRIEVSGLMGGHSGCDIDKGRGNAVRILSRLLFEASLSFGVKLIDMKCGNLRNAIPREGWAVLAIPQDQLSLFENLCEGYRKSITDEFSTLDAGVKLTVEEYKGEITRGAIDFGTQFSMIGALVALPNGVMQMSQAMEGLVESSTNLAAVRFAGDQIEVLTSQRSSTREGRDRVQGLVNATFTSASAKVVSSDGYPGWSPNLESKLLVQAKRCYTELFGEEIKVRAIHAGLECGLFLEKYPELDMVSFGPTMFDVHSPDERLEIASVERFWRYLTQIITTIE